MARVLRRAKRRSRGYNEWHIYQLLHGHDLFGVAFGNDNDFDEAAVREAWEIMRDKLLADWIREQPGTRPWAWWRWDAPAPARRERIDDRPHPFDCKARSLHIAKSDNTNFWKTAYRLHFGLPGAHLFPFDEDVYRDFMANLLRDRESTIFEPEWSFLVRHNLLRPEDSPEFLTPTEKK